MTSSTLLGQKPFHYRMNREWVKSTPEKVPVQHCHGLVEDRAGRIYLLTSHPQNNVIVLNKKGEVLNCWGTEYPQGHGLEITIEGGEEFLWITDSQKGIVNKTTLDGAVVLSVGFDAVAHHYKSREHFAPTNVAITAQGDFFLSDGYGISMIHHFDPKGKYIDSFGSMGKEPHHLNQAHAVWYDGREGREASLLICSRQDHAVKRFSLKGEWQETFSLGGFFPCNIHFSNGYFYVPHLQNAPHEHGAITIHDASFKVVATIGAEAPSYEGNQLKTLAESADNPFIYPHDLHVDAGGNIYLAQWNSGESYPICFEKVA